MSCCAAPALAYRPFDGTDAQVAPLHTIETELGPIGYLRAGDDRQLVVPALTLTFGARPGLEFAAGARRLMSMNPDVESVPLIDEIEVTFKKLLRYGSLQDKKGLSVAVEGGVFFPSREETGAGFGGTLIASQEWEDLTLHFNGELSRTREHDLGRFASVIAEGPGRWSVRPVAELSVEREGDGTPVNATVLGVLWETKARLTIDGAVRLADADEHEIELRAGLTWNKHVAKPAILKPLLKN